MTASKALIIPAAGSGSRLGTATPKPYVQLRGQAILERTIRRFLSLRALQQVLVATSSEFVGVARQLLGAILPESIEGCVVEGGRERQHSIYNALRMSADVDLVLVHDAVRPFVQPDRIEACCRAAAETGSAILGIPAKDTIKRIDEHQLILETPPRSAMWQAQTPQVFRKKILAEAYEQAVEDGFTGTDDASLVERLGHPVKMVRGSRMNIKITYPYDLELANILIENEE